MLEPYAVKIACTVLRRGGRSNPSTLFDISKPEAKLAESECLIGQLYAENAFLKKVLSSLEAKLHEHQKQREGN